MEASKTLVIYIYIYIDMHTFMKNKNMYTLSSKKKKMYTHVQRELGSPDEVSTILIHYCAFFFFWYTTLLRVAMPI